MSNEPHSGDDDPARHPSDEDSDDSGENSNDTGDGDSQKQGAERPLWKKIALATAVIVAGVVAYTQFGERLTLENLAEQESSLREFQRTYPLLVYGITFLIYVVVTGLSLPGATVLTLLYGWYFGFWRALILVSFASTAGATVAFLLCRFLFRDSMETRFGDRLKKFNEALRRDGPFFLFTLRLIPAVPFFVINAVMGLTPIATRTFWWVSQVGMFPGTVIYVYAGSSVPALQTLADDGIRAVFSPWQLVQIITAFVLLGTFPLIVRYAVKWFRSDDSVMPSETSGDSDTKNKSSEEAGTADD